MALSFTSKKYINGKLTKSDAINDSYININDDIQTLHILTFKCFLDIRKVQK